MATEINEIKNRELKEALANAALGGMEQGTDYDEPSSIKVEFGYLFQIEDHGLEALFRITTDLDVSYFAAQGESLKRLNLTPELFDAYVESFLEIHDAEPEDHENGVDRESWLETFIAMYPPASELVKPDEELLSFGKAHMPEDLLRLWTEYGFGEYGNGFLRIIDPRDYMQSLYDWLGEQDFNKIPIAMTAFGDLFYYRDLCDVGEGEHDICILDVHYRDVQVCTYPYPDFFAGYLCDDEIREQVLRKSLYEQAVEAYGVPSASDIFYFAPALCIGGAEELKYIKSGDAATHHQVLLQMNGQ